MIILLGWRPFDTICLMAKKVIIYSTPTCIYCNLAKEFFRNQGIVYEEHNVQTDILGRQEMIKKSGQMGVPVILVQDSDGREEVMIGFDNERLSQLLL